jgi:hypothetical protein
MMIDSVDRVLDDWPADQVELDVWVGTGCGERSDGFDIAPDYNSLW